MHLPHGRALASALLCVRTSFDVSPLLSSGFLFIRVLRVASTMANSNLTSEQLWADVQRTGVLRMTPVLAKGEAPSVDMKVKLAAMACANTACGKVMNSAFVKVEKDDGSESIPFCSHECLHTRSLERVLKPRLLRATRRRNTPLPPKAESSLRCHSLSFWLCFLGINLLCRQPCVPVGVCNRALTGVVAIFWADGKREAGVYGHRLGL